jgi:signal transduction histidine kinase
VSGERGRPAGSSRGTAGFALGILGYSVAARLASLAVPGTANLPWLMLQTGLGLVLYLGLAVSVWRRRASHGLLEAALGPEWALWCTSMATAFGLDADFQIHALLFLPMAILLAGHLSLRLRAALVVVPPVLYGPVVGIVAAAEPSVQLTPRTAFWLSVINQMVLTVAVLAIAVVAVAAQARARRESEARETAQMQLVEDLSHELRTPVATVLTAAQSAHDAEVGADEMLAICGRIERSARSMGRLVERLLDLADLDHGRVDAAPDTAVDEVASQVVEELQNLAASRSVLVQAALEPCDRPTNAASLGVILRNLIGNAIHHSPEGGRVEVRLASGASGATIQVEDHGDGIAAEDLPRVFDRLWRADVARSRSAGRHGLGLALARRHADLIGATLHIWSEPGRGTVVTVRLG